MKCAIYGAGAMGTVLGAYIAKAGKEIDLINRNQKHVAALKEKGAHVVGTVEKKKKVIQKRYSYSNQCNLSISEFPISEKLVIPPIILKDDDFFSETEVFKNNSGSSNQFNNQSKNLLLRKLKNELNSKNALLNSLNAYTSSQSKSKSLSLQTNLM